MILDSKIPEGNHMWTEYKTKHKPYYKRSLGLALVFSMLSAVFCSCKEYWCEKEGQYLEKYIVYKFHEGEDYSNNYLISNYFKLRPSVKPGITKPIKLHNGYWLCCSITNDPHTLTYLTFTFDEMEEGLVADDWNVYWEDYILADCPYKEYYSIGISDCHDEELELRNMIGYCQQCRNTYYVDTAWLNSMIDKGEFFELESVKRMI